MSSEHPNEENNQGTPPLPYNRKDFMNALIVNSLLSVQNHNLPTTNNEAPPVTHYTLLFIEDNIERLKRAFFIHVNTQIKYSKNFLDKDFEQYFQIFEQNFETQTPFQNFDKFCNELLTKFPKFLISTIEGMTISNTKALIDHTYIKCKIQTTAKAQLNASYSIFRPLDLSKTEFAIEIFGNSKAIYKNCHFYDAEKVAVVARNYSSVIFENCTFIGNKTSCLIMDDSYAKFINCRFKNDTNISIILSKNSKCEMFGCLFLDLKGKAIFAKDSSQVYLHDVIFINCQKGATTIAEDSTIFLDDQILIQNSQNTAIRAVKSHIKAIGVTIENTNGNAINLENSDGYIMNCEIKGTIHPTIAVIGRESNPIFHECNILDNGNTFCVICKNCCTPLFNSCYFSKCGTNCFSVSEFSHPHIQYCNFQDIEKYYINVFGGSLVTYNNLENIEIESKINASQIAIHIYKEYDEIEKQSQKIDDNIDQKSNYQSWKSPYYDNVPEITEMNDPEIIMNNILLPLKKVDINDVLHFIKNHPISFICSKCHIELNENDEPNIFCPCGHIVCKNCKNISECPICDCSVNETKKVFFEKECTVCSDKKSNTICLPCGHFCMCYECAKKCSEGNFNCPMCNEPFKSFKYCSADTYKP